MRVTLFLLFGAMVWMTSLGSWSHPAYRLMVMLAVLSWFAWMVRTPKTR